MGKNLYLARLRNHQKPDDDQVTCRKRRFKSIHDLFSIAISNVFYTFYCGTTSVKNIMSRVF